MGSTWAFKITASIIKPTRETLLDYVSYILLILSIIAIARVIIGSSDLNQECIEDMVKIPTEERGNFHRIISSGSTGPGNMTTKSMKTMRSFERIIEVHPTSLSLVQQENVTVSYCAKFYQAYFSYVLAGESLVLLLVGILWVKMPKVECLVQKFSDLLHESRKSEWFKNLPPPVNSKSLLISNKHDFQKILKDLFHSSTQYSDKAKARYLYEKIQKYSCEHERSQNLLSLYVRKSVLQLLLWLTSLSVNVVLYVELEFYVECVSLSKWCSHDTFLRIVWFLAQSLLLIYGMFNCVTLKWIINNTSSRGNCSMCLFICGCLNSVQPSDSQYFRCHSYSVFGGGKTVHNDMALLLHLVSSSNHEVLPYFTIFLFDEWGKKFSVTNHNIMHIESEGNAQERCFLLGDSSFAESSLTS